MPPLKKAVTVESAPGTSYFRSDVGRTNSADYKGLAHTLVLCKKK
jgi:hypothetical protein